MSDVKFAEILKELIQSKGVTQTALAEYLGLRSQTVSMYCSGKSYPEFMTLVKIASYFGVSTDYLITGERPENKSTREEFGLPEPALDNLKAGARGELGEGFFLLTSLLGDKNFCLEFENIAQFLQHNLQMMDIIEETESQAHRELFEEFLEFNEKKTADQLANVCLTHIKQLSEVLHIFAKENNMIFAGKR